MNKIQPIKNQWSRVKYVLGLCVLLLILFQMGYFIEFIFRVLFDIPYNSLFVVITEMVIRVAVHIVVIGIGLKDQHKTLASVFFIKKVNVKVWSAAILCAIGFTLFGLYLEILFFSFKYDWNTSFGVTEGNVWLNIMSHAIIPAITEEILFKGLIFTILKKYYSTITAVIIASLMFAGLHMSFIRIIPLLVFSCYTFWLYLRSGNIILPMLLHFTNNLFVMVLINEPFDYVGTFYAGLALFLIGSYFLYKASKISKAENIP